MCLSSYNTGLCQEGCLHCHSRSPEEHSGRLLEDGVGERSLCHCYADSARREGQGQCCMHTHTHTHHHACTITHTHHRSITHSHHHKIILSDCHTLTPSHHHTSHNTHRNNVSSIGLRLSTVLRRWVASLLSLFQRTHLRITSVARSKSLMSL